MPPPKTPGATSAAVGANMRRLRTLAGVGLRDAAAGLTGLGAPIGHATLSRVELGTVPATVDVLTAAAVLYGVTPLTLLTPPAEYAMEAVELTGWAGEALRVWQWLRGDRPARGTLPGGESDGADIERFQNRSWPTWAPRGRTGA